MALPRVVAVAPDSPAALAGVCVGDEIVAMNGERPRDVIDYHRLADAPHLELDLSRSGIEVGVDVRRRGGEPLGIEVDSPLFDQVRTCDNHCEFCFIYQLPTGLRRSLYVKDDDYRLSFLYGNYTTLTRFTEADLERIVTEGLSPINVSIHATDGAVRAEMLRNPRGATSLRWLRALLDHGVEVHGQVVCCPGVNDGAVLEDTLCGVLDRYPELASLCVVPLGVSRYTAEGRLRPHTASEAAAVVDTVEQWQERFLDLLGRRVVFAADEYYLLADRPFPPAEAYEGFPMHEDGVGMAACLAEEVRGGGQRSSREDFFRWVDGAPAAGYRAPRGGTDVVLRPRRARTPTILTGELGAAVLAPLVEELGADARILAVPNRFFGGNIGVTGLLVGEDLAAVLEAEPPDGRYVLPDVCLSGGRFLDGTSPTDLPRPVEVVPTDGEALRSVLGVSA